MQTWRVIALSCVLAVGCGGPLPEETPPSDEQGTEEVSPAEASEGDVSALWKNGEPTLGPVRLVKDVFPEDTSFRGRGPENLVSFRGKLFFTARHEDGRQELWKSNGTTAGTVVVVEFPPLGTPGGGFGFLSDLTPVGRKLFFVLEDEAHGRELWVTDGTREGTRLVKDIAPGPEGSGLHDLVAVGNTLFFFRTFGAPEQPPRTELWTSNGTEEGTVRVRDFGPETPGLRDRPVVRGDTLFFLLSVAGDASELWRSNGSPAGTVRLKTFAPDPQFFAPSSLRVAGRFIYFIGFDPAHGDELWRTDGTSAGTVLAADITPGPDSSFLQLLDVAGGNLFFVTRVLAGSESRLYKVSGSSPSAPTVVTILPNPFADRPEVFTFITSFASTGKKLFFSLAFFGTGPAPFEHQLWVTNGTNSGTKLVHRPLSRSDEFTTELFPVDDLLLFPGNEADEKTGTELWVSNGTVNGTRLVEDINPGFVSSNPHSFTRVNDCVFFVAAREGLGNVLWVIHLRRSSRDSVSAER